MTRPHIPESLHWSSRHAAGFFHRIAICPSRVIPKGMVHRPSFQAEIVFTKKGAPSEIRLLSIRPRSFVVMEEICAWTLAVK
jgi:hypothetical protein